jgi:hypothetical protein
VLPAHVIAHSLPAHVITHSLPTAPAEDLFAPAHSLPTAPAPPLVSPPESNIETTIQALEASMHAGVVMPPNMTGRMLLAQQLRLQQLIREGGAISRATFAREMTIVARLALLDGQYRAAVDAYKIVGQHVGALDQPDENHQHIHLHSPDGRPPQHPDFARATDAELRRIIDEVQEAAPNATPADHPPASVPVQAHPPG